MKGSGVFRYFARRLLDARIKIIHRVNRKNHKSEQYRKVDIILEQFHSRGGLKHEFQAYKLFSLMKILKQENPKTILELGTGSTTPVFADYVRESDDRYYTGVDESKKWLRNSMEMAGVRNDGRFRFNWAKKVTLDVYDYVMDKIPVVQSASIIFTGKTSFHILCDFGRKHKIDTIRFLLQKFLRNSPLSKVYTIEAKRKSGIPNLDLSPNKIRGNYITLHSLSLIGLRCMEIPYLQLKNFDPRKAILK